MNWSFCCRHPWVPVAPQISPSRVRVGKVAPNKLEIRGIYNLAQIVFLYILYVNDTSSKYSDHNLTIRPSISAIDRSSECVIYATLDFQETAFSANYWGTLPGTSQAPGSDTTRELHLAEFIVHRWGGRSWVSVT